MKKKLITISLCLLSIGLFAQDKSWKLVWADEFDYVGLPDKTKWNFDTKGNSYGWGNNELQWYTDSETANANVSNGILRITALRKESNGKKYTSARLTTRNKGDWKYGRMEICAKLPVGIGTWPAIWMLPTESPYGGWPECGEIDIMEHVGYSPDSVFSTVHTGRFNHIKNTQVGKSTYSPKVTSQFHVYTLEWDENEIRSFIDDVHYFTFKNNKEGFTSWPFDQEFHLILNIAIGGGLGGKHGVDETRFPHYMDIDYVRVYQK